MNILFFVSSLNAGGAERVATTLANGWVERGYHVTLVVTYLGSDPDLISFYPLHSDVRVIGLGQRISRLLRRYGSPVAKLWVMRRLVRSSQPDVVLSFLTNVNVNVLMATRRLNVPVLVCERTNPIYGESAGSVLRTLRRWLYPVADAVLVQTPDSIADMHATVSRLSQVVALPNPLPPELLTDSTSLPAAAQACYGNADGRMHIAAMGRLVASKQFDQLIDAFSMVAHRHPGWDLTIFGEGPLRSDLEQQVSALGLSGRVQLPGTTNQPWQALAQAQLFAMTSRVEGFPNALLEAMALGLPAVVMDCPNGPADITRQGQLARLIPQGAVQEFAVALAELMADAAQRRRLGTQAARDLSTRYSLGSILDQWDTVFQHVTQPPRSA